MRAYKSVPRESNVEDSLKRAIEKEPDVVYWKKNAAASFYSSNSWPDRTLYGQQGFAMLVEVKRPGKDADPDQAKCHAALRKAGHIVYVIDNREDLIAAYRKEYAAWLRQRKLAGPLRKFLAACKLVKHRAPAKPKLAKPSGSRVSTKK